MAPGTAAGRPLPEGARSAGPVRPLGTRAGRALAGLALAALALVGAGLLPAPALAQSTDDPIWSATMTVGESTSGDRGYDGTGSGVETYGSVDGSSLMYNGVNVSVNHVVRFATYLQFWVDNGEVEFDQTHANGLVLEVAGEQLPFSSADSRNTWRARWDSAWLSTNASSLDDDNYATTLAVGNTVAVCLRTATQTCPSSSTTTPTPTPTPTNTDATGAPSISGTPQVGQTLTAGAGDMADTDNLPTTTFPAGYEFQWVRVDSSDIETDIMGATSQTYDPVVADVGNRLKVEVSFTDGGNTDETLPSAVMDDAVVSKQEDCTTDRPDSDWCATMTVGDGGLPLPVQKYGYDSDSNDGYGSLDDNTINYGGRTWTVSTLNENGNVVLNTLQLNIKLNNYVPSGSVFDIGGTGFTDTPSNRASRGIYSWAGSNFSWLDGQKVTVSANLAPIPVSATVDGTLLVLTFAEDLDTNSVPAVGAFTVEKTPDGGTETTVTVSGTPAVSGKTVTLTLAAAVVSTDTGIKVTYTKPASNPLRDESEIEAPRFTDFAVTNNTGAACTIALGGRTEIWSGTVTVAEYWIGPPIGPAHAYGYNGSTSDGALSDNQFDFGSTTGLTVYEIGVGNPNYPTTAGRLDFTVDSTLSNAELPALRLHVCGDTFEPDAATRVNSILRWNNTGLDWSTTASVNLALSASPDATLSGLSLKDASNTAVALNETFDAATLAYTADVPNGTARITLSPAVNEKGALVVYKDGNDAVLTDVDDQTEGFQQDLDTGANVVKVEVTPGDRASANVKTYTVTVTLAAATSTNTTPTSPGVFPGYKLLSGLGRSTTTFRVNGPNWRAQRFTTGYNDTGYQITGFELWRSTFFGTISGQASIWTDEGGRPGVKVFDLSLSGALSTDDVIRHTASPPGMLDANTSYFAVMQPSGSGSFTVLSGGGMYRADTGWDLARGHLVRNDDGTSWTPDTTDSNAKLLIGIYGRAKPSPNAELRTLELLEAGGAAVSVPFLPPVFHNREPFNPEAHYKATVSQETAIATVLAEPADSSATVEYLRSDGTPIEDEDMNEPGHQVELWSYANPVGIRVTSTDGTITKVKTHTLTVRRQGSPAQVPAIGKPVIKGTPRVGETLTLDMSAVTDANGTYFAETDWSPHGFRIFWGIDTSETDSPNVVWIIGSRGTVTLGDVHEGKRVYVGVSFKDDLGNPEHRVSELTAPVQGQELVISGDGAVTGSRCDFVFPAGARCEGELSARDVGPPLKVTTRAGVAVSASQVTFTVANPSTMTRLDEFGNSQEASYKFGITSGGQLRTVMDETYPHVEAPLCTRKEDGSCKTGSIRPGSWTLAPVYVKVTAETTDGRRGTYRIPVWVTMHPDAVRVDAVDDLRCDGGQCYGRALVPGQVLYAPQTPGAPLRSDDGVALTGNFEEVPASHDGATAFTVRLALSAPITNTAADLRDNAVSVTGATLDKLATINDRADLWGLTLTPDGAGEVTVSVAAAGSCGDPGTLCTAEDKALAETVKATVAGPGAQAVTVSIAAVSSPVTEGAAAAFRLSRTGDTAAALTVAVSVTGEGAVLAGTPATAVAFAAGSAEATLSVATTDDAVAEADGRVTAALAAGPGYLVDGAAGSARVDVYDNDKAVPGEPETLWSSTLEWQGDYGAGWVNADAEDFSSPDWSEDGSACSILYIAYGAASRELWLRADADLCKDGIPEPETLTLQVGGITVGPGPGLSDFADRTIGIVTGVEADWDVGDRVEVRLARTAEAEETTASGPGISVADAQVREAEGAALAFVVTLSQAQASAVSVRYATSDGTATAGLDYEAVSGTVRFAPGETAQTVPVPVLVDADDEGPETLTLTLSAPFGAVIADGEANGTIDNDDAAVAGSPAAAPLTASFADLPAEHDGTTRFSVGIVFSEAPAGVKNADIRRVVQVTGGTKRGMRRVNGSYAHRTLAIDPDGHGPVTVTLPATSDCADADALCTAQGGRLENGVSVEILGPPGLTVADAEVDEGAENAALAFEVTLSRTASGAVTVAYATSDGTAVAPGDYTSKSGTLTFAVGETEKTVSVPVTADAENEPSETMTLTLSNPTGAYLEDATATGTITNDGPIPRAWMARFGRTVADQVLDAVDARLRGARSPGVEATVAGQALSFGPSSGDAGAVAEREEEARTEALGAWLRGEDDEEDRAALSGTRTLSGRELFTGTSFSLTGGTPGEGTVSAWGHGAITSFDGREDDLTLDGEVGNLMLGADFVRGRATAGLMLSHARGSGGYRGASSGSIEANLTGLYPYGRYEASDRLSVWGVAGYGEGTLTVDPEAQAAMETDMGLAMASVGVRGILMKAPPEGGVELAVKSDAMAVHTSSEAVSGDTGNLAAEQADVTRLRLGLEGSRAFRFEGGASLTPSVEFGVRHDGGDAETGFGTDVGAGLAWSDPARGLNGDVRARGLLTHEDGNFRDRGVAGSLAWDPAPDTARGPSLSLTQTVGARASGGVEALLGPQTARALEAANGNDANELERRTLEAKLGYGFAIFDGRWTGTPEFGLGLSDASRETVLGWRLAEEARGGLAFGLDVEGARQESAGARPGHRFGLGFGWRLQDAGAGQFEVRFEGSRIEPANDDAEHRLGLTLSARW